MCAREDDEGVCRFTGFSSYDNGAAARMTNTSKFFAAGLRFAKVIGEIFPSRYREEISLPMLAPVTGVSSKLVHYIRQKGTWDFFKSWATPRIKCSP
jgi:hypothetical protein